MTDKVVDKAVDEPGNDGNLDGGSEETVESLKAQLAEVQADAVKQRKIAKEAIAKRDAVKKTGNEDGQEYKKLFEQSEAKAAKVIERAKKADISAAATTQLQKIGVTADGMPAALRLLDMNGIEWDEDDGVDATSLKAAVATLKNEFGVLFEKSVKSPSLKVPKDGNSSGDDGTITRTEFEKLDAAAKNAAMLKKIKIVSG